MADLINSLNQQVQVGNDVIVEPYNAPSPSVVDQAKNQFPPEVFKLTPTSNLYKFLLGLLGDSGVGGMKKAFLSSRLQQSIGNTHFVDLDSFTTPFNFPRLIDEVYAPDAANELLTDDQWQLVRSADAKYRARFLDYLHGIQAGMTEDGAALIARSATGYDAEIFPRWKYLDDLISDAPVGFPNLGNTTSRNEIVVLPNVATLTESQKAILNSTFYRIKSVGTDISFVAEGSAVTSIFTREVLASSEFFYIKKFVTGNTSISYPGTSNANNNWIVPGSAIEAPNYAFNTSQETLDFITIQSSSASSYQLGPYNAIQQAIFPFLDNIPSPTFTFTPDQAYASASQLEVSTPWLVRQDELPLFINKNYPIQYLDLITPQKQNKLWWSSQEYLAPVQDWLVLNFDAPHHINNLEFEISTKPVDIVIEWSTDSGVTWSDVTFNDKNLNTVALFYDSSATYLWETANFSFQCLDSNGKLVQPNAMRVVFSRRYDPFPFPNTPAFAWSIDVRNLRASYLVAQESDFYPDTGTDFLGNAYTTQFKNYPATAVFSGSSSFWQSRANPSPFAVESLYFNMTNPSGSAQTFDQIFIDPITTGNSLHIYYSNDDIGASTAGVSFANGSAFMQGNYLWNDHFVDGPDPSLWDSSSNIMGLYFPDFNNVGASADYFKTGIISVGSAFSVGGNITQQGYGRGDTTVLLSNAGKYGTAGSYLELDVALQGTTFSTGYSLQYQLTTSAYGGSANIVLKSILNGTAITTVTKAIPALASEDILGIRNDTSNGFAYMYTVPGGLTGTPILQGSVAALAGVSTGGRTAIIIEDVNSPPLSVDQISFQEIHQYGAADWDSKLWTPVHKNYTTKRGYLKLPNPITAKYVKLEFSNLTPTPYPTFYAPNLPDIQFNAYPSWVVSYIEPLAPRVTILNQLQPDNVMTNNINLGLQQPNPSLYTDSKPESIFDYIASIENSPGTGVPTLNIGLNNNNNQLPQIYPNTLFQESDLFSTVLTPDPLATRHLILNTGAATDFSQEIPVGAYDVGPITARNDTSVIGERNYPILFFPRTCRHAYQVVETQRDQQLAYNVVIRQIGFYRTDQTVFTNNETYFETLDDTSSTESSNFVPGNYAYVIPFSNISLGPNISTFGFESFDGPTWLVSP